MEEELDAVLKKFKSRKSAGLNEILPEVEKTIKFDDIVLRFCNKQNTIEKWTRGCFLLFSKKGDLGITKNYRNITLTAIATKLYNAILLNHILPEIEKILGKRRTFFWEIDPHLQRFWQSVESAKEYVQKFLRQHYCWLVGCLGLRYINLCWLFNTKSIFM